MEKDSDRICLCPLEGIITTIAKKWAILIISILGHHERLRFNDIMEILGGISPKSLTDTLKELQIIPLVRWAEKRDNLPEKTCHATCGFSEGCPSRREGR